MPNENPEIVLATTIPTPASPAEEGGWIPWAGGTCPVASKTLIEVKLRSGVTGFGRAGGYSWDHRKEDPSQDIIAYWTCAQVVREAVEAEREACAKLAECPGFVAAQDTEWDTGFNDAKRMIAAAIRSRSQRSEP